MLPPYVISDSSFPVKMAVAWFNMNIVVKRTARKKCNLNILIKLNC